eukprot:8203583-Alexandrium_andersonii.AAC.1
MPRPRMALQSRLLMLMKLRAQLLRPPTTPLAVPVAKRTGTGRARWSQDAPCRPARCARCRRGSKAWRNG